MYPSLLYHRSSFHTSQIQAVLPRRKDDAFVIDLLANLQYGYRSNMCYVRSILLKHKQTLACTLPFRRQRYCKQTLRFFVACCERMRNHMSYVSKVSAEKMFKVDLHVSEIGRPSAHAF